MSAKEFDYVSAWHQLAKPAIKHLSGIQLTVLRQVAPDLKELSQDKDSNIPISIAVRKKLECLNTKELAELAQTTEYYGHWKPSKVKTEEWFYGGCGWKVSNVCDQILRERIKDIYPNQIYQGVFRVTYSSRDCWLWEEWGLATEENLEAFKTCGLGFNQDKLEESAKKLSRIVPHKKWDTNPFMIWPEKSEEREFQNLLPKNNLVYFDEFKSVNFKPHPFMIGPKHFPMNGGMYIQPEQAPCTMPSCGMDYKNHTSERIIILTLLQNVVWKELQPTLLSVKEWTESKKFSGFGFNENGFKIINEA